MSPEHVRASSRSRSGIHAASAAALRSHHPGAFGLFRPTRLSRSAVSTCTVTVSPALHCAAAAALTAPDSAAALDPRARWESFCHNESSTDDPRSVVIRVTNGRFCYGNCERELE